MNRNQLRFTGVLILLAALAVAMRVSIPAGILVAFMGAASLQLGGSLCLGDVSRIQSLSTQPLLTTFAVTSSQRAIQPIARYLAPLVEVGDVTGRYKKYTDKHRFRVPQTRRSIGTKATVIGFEATDIPLALINNALDFPIPNINGMSDEALTFAMMEGQQTLADISGLSHENEVVTTAIDALTAAKVNFDFSLNNDPITILDAICLDVVRAAKNGAPIKILFGATAFKKLRANANVRGKFVVSNRGGDKAGVGVVSPTIGDISNLLMLNPETKLSMFVIDNAPEGKEADIQVLLDDKVIIFASNDAPNRMDPSFMKTFVPMGGFFRPGSYTTEDQRDQVMKMDWTAEVSVTNTVAGKLIDTTTGLAQTV